MIEIKIKGLKSTIKALDKFSQSINKYDKTYRSIGNALIREVIKYFKQQGRTPGSWEKLSEYTVSERVHATHNRKQRKNYDIGIFKGKILVDTGTLKGSFNFNIQGNKLFFGSTDPKSKIHEEGKNNIPARKMLPSKKRVQEIAHQIFTTQIEKAIKETGLF